MLLYFYHYNSMTISSMGTLVSWELLFIISFSFFVKVPAFFFHIWLPKAHVESPTFLSVILASLLLKLGTSGLVKFSFIFSYYSYIWFIPGLLIPSIMAFSTSDSKKVVAYSSISHMSFVLFGIYTLSNINLPMTVLIMLFHGLVSSNMFYLVGTMSHKTMSRSLYYLNSFMNSFLGLSIIMIFTFLLNFSVPPSLGFFGELIILVNLFSVTNSSPFLLFYLLITAYFSLFILMNMMSGKLNIMSKSTSGMNTLLFVVLSLFFPMLLILMF